MPKQRQPAKVKQILPPNHTPESDERLRIAATGTPAERAAMERKFKRDQFVTALAKSMVDLQAGKGIALGMPSGVIPWAREWASLRQATPLHGYPTLKEAEDVLREFLGWS